MSDKSFKADDPKPAPAPVVKKADAPKITDSVGRLRAFEDETFGKDAVRINDKIERGVGSPFAAMSDVQKMQYAALEKLVAAEQKLADVTGAAKQAEADVAAAQAELDACEKKVRDAAAAK